MGQTDVTVSAPEVLYTIIQQANGSETGSAEACTRLFTAMMIFTGYF